MGVEIDASSYPLAAHVGSGCDHCANIHIYDEHRGLAHRCGCGIVLRMGLLVGRCETCNGLVSNSEIIGVEPVAVWQIHHRTSGARDRQQLELDFGDLPESANCSASWGSD